MATDFDLKNAKPQQKDYVISVSEGLSLLIKSTGNKLWRYRYSYAKKRCMISLGQYPQVTMKQAKSKQRQYINLLEEDINPSTHKHIQKNHLSDSKTLKEVAKEWYKKRYQSGHYKESRMVLGRLEKYLYPVLGKVPIKQIDPPMLFNMIEAIQENGTIETGKRVNSYCSMIFRYAVAKGYCDRDMTNDYKGMLKTKAVKHMPALTDIDEISEFMHDIENHIGTDKVKYALKISAYIFTRPSELVNSKWAFIDFDQSHWLIPAEFMKMKRDHLIPFPKQVKDLLLLLKPITGHHTYIFPSDKHYDEDMPMHAETVNKAIRRLNDGKYIGRMVSHGFRGMASTILNEHKFRGDVIEKQLAHQEGNKIRGAYNHAEYLEERTEMMQWYADYLNNL